MIEVRRLMRRYGPLTAVHDLSFEVRPGEVSWSAGAEWVRQEHHGQSPDRSPPSDQRPRPARWTGRARRCDELQVDPRLRLGRAAPLFLHDRPRCTSAGRPPSRDARCCTGRQDRAVPHAARHLGRSLPDTLVVIQGHAAEGPHRRCRPPQPAHRRARRAVFPDSTSAPHGS